MEFRQLRYFVEIAAAGNISKAAHTLNIAQSALSSQIRLLEQDLQVMLLHRQPRGVVLTEAGILFLAQAKSILRQVEDARLLVRDVSLEPRGKVILGFSPSISNVLALPLLRAARARLPQVELELTEQITANLAVNLENSAIDIAILIKNSDFTAFHIRPLVMEELFLITHPDMTCSELSLMELLARPLLLPAKGSGIRPILDEAARNAGLPAPDPVLELNSVAILSASIAAGLGDTVLTTMAVRSELEKGELVALPVTDRPLNRVINLCRLKSRPPSIATMALEDLIVEVAAELVEAGSWPNAQMLAA